MLMINMSTITQRFLMSTLEKPSLHIEKIAKNFGAVQAIKEVSFDVWPGEVVALVGDNGGGSIPTELGDATKLSRIFLHNKMYVINRLGTTDAAADSSIDIAAQIASNNVREGLQFLKQGAQNAGLI